MGGKKRGEKGGEKEIFGGAFKTKEERRKSLDTSHVVRDEMTPALAPEARNVLPEKNAANLTKTPAAKRRHNKPRT